MIVILQELYLTNFTFLQVTVRPSCQDQQLAADDDAMTWTLVSHNSW